MKLRRTLQRRGSIFQSTSDTEVVIHLVATSEFSTTLDRLTDALKQVEGAYSLLVLTQEWPDRLPRPARHSSAGHGKLGEATIFASETVALDVIGATFLRDVDPGELIVVNDSGIRSFRPFAKAEPRPCIFEHVYFSRPDSVAEGKSVYEVRKNIGAELSREAPVEADYVVPIPTAAYPPRSASARQAESRSSLASSAAHDVGRTFIQPSQDVRHLGVKLKHNANSALVDGKRIVLIDDSIVARHDVGQDRPNDARCRRARSAFARVAADHPQLLLRRRHARALEAAGGRR